MRKLIIATLLLLAPAALLASETAHLEQANIDLRDQASLQRGAKYFVNYCMGCHSLQYMRYNRLAKDLGIDEVTLRQTLLFGDAKPGDLMTNAMRAEDALKWFGTAVPDLTLVTRWRSPDWVYTYLKSFYADDTRPYGVNNVVFPLVGMPHVLGDLQGKQEPILEHAHEGGGEPVVSGVKLVKQGSLSPAEYDTMVRDITGFLTYAGEPMQLERQRLGAYVLMFLGVLFVLAYLLKKEYWTLPTAQATLAHRPPQGCVAAVILCPLTHAPWISPQRTEHRSAMSRRWPSHQRRGQAAWRIVRPEWRDTRFLRLCPTQVSTLGQGCRAEASTDRP